MVYNYTKPRGPIAAMYGSPGPCYGLPGLVGQKTHDPRSVHYKGPAYPFGVRHGKFKDDCSPGPCYNPNPKIYRNGIDGTPHYSLYSRQKDLATFKSPGPGAYSPEQAVDKVHHSPAKYSFGTRHRHRKADNTPAPNCYTLDPMLGKTAVSGKRQYPIYTLRGRHKIGDFAEDLARTPGPSNYNTVDQNVYLHKPPIFSMTSRNAMPGDATQKPGPGAHSPERAPGPGTYNTTDPSLYKDKSPLYSMTSRNVMPGDTTKKPGPGAHSPENVKINKNQAPAPSFGIRHSQYTAPLIVDVPDV